MKKDGSGNNIFVTRYRMIAGLIVILMCVLAVRLFVVTIVQHKHWSDLATSQSTKQIKTSAARGNIYDRNGELLAGNKQVFNVVFTASGLSTKEINSNALSLMNLLEKNGDTVKDDFPIKFRKDGTMYWSYGAEKKKWLNKHNYSQDLTAEQAFKAICKEYNVSSSLTRYEAYKLLTETYQIDVPISVSTMDYIYDLQKKNFLSQWGSNVFSDKEIKKGVSAEEAFKKLRKAYKISSSLSNEDARKILLIRNRVKKEGQSYIPVKISTKVSDTTIAQISENAVKGASISSGYERYYPNGSLAAHVIGYMGSISETMLDKLESKGYSNDDLVGQSGIESAYETKLHGTDGEKMIRVNASGDQVGVVSETKAKKGKDVYLTIDKDIQAAAESALARQVNSGSATCKSGAVVAMDVKTGEILAMASYPTYDPNIFAGGITTKAWESVQSENPRDPIAPAPLYNNATMAAAPPGSTFKPIVALTGLRLGLNPDQYIVDRGYIQIGSIKWKTSLYNLNGGTEGAENLEWGIGHSSNYYFYCVATGKDWGTGKSLGYSIGIPDILKTAKAFGLGKKTGVEIGERVAATPSEKKKIANYKVNCYNYLYENKHTFYPDSIANSPSKLKKEINIVVSWLEDNPSYSKLVSLMKSKTKIKSSQIETAASNVKFNYFEQAHWSTGDQFNVGIGQGDNLYTPLQVATYCAALGNNATYTRASLVSGVQGEGMVKKTGTKISLVTDSQLAAVYKGIRRVVLSGSLEGSLGSFETAVMGKTGTAENQGTPQPASEVDYVKEHLGNWNSQAGTSITWSQIKKEMKKLMRKDPVTYSSEDNAVDRAVKELSDYKITQSMIDSAKGSYNYYAWTMSLAPADNPRIAVVTMLIQGGFSANAAPVNRDTMQAYFDKYGGTSKHVNVVGTVEKTDQTGVNVKD
ncbi:MAG: penicillin-binding transpeptidase domain-containing protein [Eubacteriales bacterium]|nr:penicillin-binding transpeptidase domain-containing protein [Eubacteriales bacterium]